MSDFNPTVQMVALLLGGGPALSSHGVKATLRAAANVSPEPVTNWTLSILEDIFFIGAAALQFCRKHDMLRLVKSDTPH